VLRLRHKAVGRIGDQSDHAWILVDLLPARCDNGDDDDDADGDDGDPNASL
jgi:hypothetical protein